MLKGSICTTSAHQVVCSFIFALYLNRIIAQKAMCKTYRTWWSSLYPTLLGVFFFFLNTTSSQYTGFTSSKRMKMSLAHNLRSSPAPLWVTRFPFSTKKPTLSVLWWLNMLNYSPKVHNMVHRCVDISDMRWTAQRIKVLQLNTRVWGCYSTIIYMWWSRVTRTILMLIHFLYHHVLKRFILLTP